MSRAERDVMTLHGLYACRKAARFILGDKFTETLKPWQEVISAHMKAKRRSELQAVIDLSAKLYNDTDGTGLMLLMAAAVEMIEPSASPLVVGAQE